MGISSEFKEENYEEKYKNDPRYIPTPKCPSCGNPGERFVTNVNSRFHSCPSCNIVYITQTMEEQKRRESIKAQATQQVKKETEVNEFIKNNKDDLPPPPRLINSYLSEYVIGQENARKVLAVATYNHYKRVKRNFLIELEKERSNPQLSEGKTVDKTQNPMAIHTNLTGHILRPRDGEKGSTIDIQNIAIQNKIRNQAGRGFPAPPTDNKENSNDFAHIEALSSKVLKERLENEIKYSQDQKL